MKKHLVDALIKEVEVNAAYKLDEGVTDNAPYNTAKYKMIADDDITDSSKS